MATYDYSKIAKQIRKEVEESIQSEVSDIDLSEIINQIIADNKIDLSQLKIDSSELKTLLEDTIKKVFKTTSTKIKEKIDLTDYIDLNEKQLLDTIEKIQDDLEDAADKGNKTLTKHLTNNFVKAVSVGLAKEFKEIESVYKEELDDLLSKIEYQGEIKNGVMEWDEKKAASSPLTAEAKRLGQLKTDVIKQTAEIKDTLDQFDKQWSEWQEEEKFEVLSDESYEKITDYYDKINEEIKKGNYSIEEAVEDFTDYFNKLAGIKPDKQADSINKLSASYSTLFEEISKAKGLDKVLELSKTDNALKQLLIDLKLVDKETQEYIEVSQGNKHEGGLIGDDSVVLIRDLTKDQNLFDNTIKLKQKLDEAATAGVNVARIIKLIRDENDKMMEVQERMSGKAMGDGTVEGAVNLDFLQATDEQIQKLAEDFLKLRDLGLSVDVNLSNLFYDSNKGFGFIDLGLETQKYSIEDELQEFYDGIYGTIRDHNEELGTNIEKTPLVKDFYDKLASQVKAMAKDLVDTAEETTADEQDSNSPSKVAEKLGEYWGEGYAQGIRKHKGEVEAAVRELVEAGELTIQDLQDDLDSLLAGKFGNRYKDLLDPLENITSVHINMDEINPAWNEFESFGEKIGESIATGVSKAFDLFKESGGMSVSEIIDTGYFSRLEEATDYLGEKYTNLLYNRDDDRMIWNETLVNIEYFKELIPYLNLTADELKVIQAQLYTLDRIKPGGQWEKVGSHMEAVDRLQSISDIMTGKRDVTTEELESANSLLKAIKESIQQEAQAIEQTATETSALQAEAQNKFQSELEETKAKLKEAEESVESYQRQMESLSAELNHANEELNVVEDKLNEAQRDADAGWGAAQNRAEDQWVAEAKRDEIQKELDTEKEKTEELQKQIDLKEEQIQRAQEAADDGEREIERLEKEVRSQKEFNETLSSQIDESREANQHLVDQTKELQNQIEVTSQENDELKEKLELAEKIKQEFEETAKVASEGSGGGGQEPPSGGGSGTGGGNGKGPRDEYERNKMLEKLYRAYKKLISTEIEYQTLVEKETVNGGLNAQQTKRLQTIFQNRKESLKHVETLPVKSVASEELKRLWEDYQKAAEAIAKQYVESWNAEQAAKETERQNKAAAKEAERQNKAAAKEIERQNKEAAKEAERQAKELERQNKAVAKEAERLSQIEAKETANIQKAYQTQFNKLKQVISKDQHVISEEVKNFYDELSGKDMSTEPSDAVQKYTQNIKELLDTLEKRGNETKLLSNIKNASKTLQENSGMSKDLARSYKELIDVMEAMASQGGYTNKEVADMTHQLLKLDTALAQSGKAGKSFVSTIFNDIRTSSARVIAQYLSIQDFIRYGRNAINVVSDLDKALTTMSYTMNISDTQVKQFGKDIVAMAKDLSISVDNVSQIYQIYANMQTSAEEIMETAKPTAILANLSGVDASTAADQIQGVINQFDLLAEDSMHIVDVYDKISSNIAVDYSKGIAGMSDAVKNVGNVAKDAGLSFEQLSAIIGKVMERTRQDGSTIGNALRTIFVRLSKASKLAGDEVDTSILSNASKALHEIGIEVYTAEGEFREFDVIMGELSQQWDKLTDAQQANISFQIAATRQTSLLQAVLAEYADSMELAAEATEAEGNALANQAKYEESIAGKAQTLKNEFSEMAINILNSNLIKEVLDGINEFVAGLNDASSTAGLLVKTIGDLFNIILKGVNALPDGGLAGIIFGLTKGKNLFANISNLAGINVGIGSLKKTFGSNFFVNSNDIELFKEYTSLLDQGLNDAEAWNQTMGYASYAAQQLSTSGKDLNVVLQTMEKRSFAASVGAKALNMALSIGLTIAINEIINLLSKVTNAEKNFAKASQALAESVQTTEKSIDSFAKEISTLQNKINDESTSVEDVVKAKNDLYNIQDKLIEQFGNVANGVDLITAAINGEIQALETLKEENWQEELAKFNADEGNRPDLIGDKISGTFIESMLTGFLEFFNGKEATDKFMNKLLGDNKKSSAQLAYEKWLNGDMEHNAFAKQYFEKEILAKQYTETYQALKDLDQEYNQALRSVEGVTNDRMQDFADRYVNLISQFTNLGQEKIGTIFTSLAQNVKTNNNRIESQKQIQQEITDRVTELYKTMISGVFTKGGTLLSNDELEDTGWISENIIKALDIDSGAKFTILHNALVEVEREGTYTFEALTKKYNQFFNETYSTAKSSPLTEWLQQSSDISNGKDSTYMRNELINAYESAVNSFSDYITNDKEGKIQVDFTKLINITSESGSLFQQLGMNNFEDYLKKYGMDASAVMAYVRDMREKLMNGMGEFDTQDKNLLIQTLEEIEQKALGISPNIDKLGQSYEELTKELEKAQKGESYEIDQLNDLLAKYPQLTDAVKKNSDGTFSIYEDNIKNLIDEYGKLYNSEASYTYWSVKNALERTLAISTQNLALEDALTLYHELMSEVGGADTIHYNKLFGLHTDEIVDLIRQFEKADKDFKNLKELGGGDSGNNSETSMSQFDWLESYLDNYARKVDKLTTAYDNLDKKLQSTYGAEQAYYKDLNENLKETNAAIDEEIAALKIAKQERDDRIDKNGKLYKDLYAAFDNNKSKANDIVEQVKKQYNDLGIYSLKEYTSEQQSAITAIMNDYTAGLDIENKILEDENKKVENNLKMYQNELEAITTKYDHVIKEFENREAELNHYQNMLTNQGMMENEQYYIALLDNESRTIKANIDQREELIKQLDKLNTTNKAGTDEWWNTKDAIDECTKSIWESQEAVESYRMSMMKLGWDLDDRIMDIKKSVTDETTFLLDTLSVFDADMYSYTREYLGNEAEKTKIYNGVMSDAGMATLALRRTNLQAYTELIDEYDKLVEEAEQTYLSNTANTEYLDRLKTLKSERNDLIQSYNDEREAIVSLVRDGYDKQLQSLDALTSKYMEAKNAEKDLYDYQKSIAKQTKNISDIRKQMVAYAGDTSQEAKNKLQQLKVSLEEAEESLSDQEYQRQLSDQQAIFDRLYMSLEDYFNDKLEDQATLVDSTKQLVSDNLPNIKKTLADTLSYYKQDLPTTIENVLDNGITDVTGVIDVLDGDVKSISDSVRNQTAELTAYLAAHGIDLTDEQTIYNSIKEMGEKSILKVPFDQFNVIMNDIDSYIKEANERNTPSGLSKELEDTVKTAGTELADTTASALEKYFSEQKVTGAVGTLASVLKPKIGGGISTLIGFASGTKKVNGNLLAWTQENGLEAIIRPTDNAILTPLKAGDSVLPADATKNLWNIATDPAKYLKDNLSNIVSTGSNAVFNNTMSPTIVLPNVTNVNEFMAELQKNKQFESMIQDMTIKQLSGGSALAKLKYKF